MANNRVLLEIDIITQDFNEFKISEDELRKYFGCSDIITKYLYQNLDSSIYSLHPDNSLLFSPGLLTGIHIPTASKISICGRSPLIGIWNEATVDGHWGVTLKKNGYEGIIIKGKTSHPVYFLVNSDGISFEDAQTLKR